MNFWFLTFCKSSLYIILLWQACVKYTQDYAIYPLYDQSLVWPVTLHSQPPYRTYFVASGTLSPYPPYTFIPSYLFFIPALPALWSLQFENMHCIVNDIQHLSFWIPWYKMLGFTLYTFYEHYVMSGVS